MLSATSVSKQPSKFGVFVNSTVRVLFATLLFTAGGMGLGLLLGIIGTIIYGALHGWQIDMRNAYLHFAIPFALTAGAIAFAGALVLEIRARRT